MHIAERELKSDLSLKESKIVVLNKHMTLGKENEESAASEPQTIGGLIWKKAN